MVGWFVGRGVRVGLHRKAQGFFNGLRGTPSTPMNSALPLSVHFYDIVVRFAIDGCCVRVCVLSCSVAPDAQPKKPYGQVALSVKLSMLNHIW